MPTTSKSVEAGKETLAYCTACKMDLAHIVVAMKGDRIAKVECKTCKKTHVYKAPKGITEPPKKKVRKTKEQKAAEEQTQTIQAEWTKLMAQNKGNPVKNYTMKSHFALGDRVSHPNFGEGIINRLIYPNKVEVLFQDYMKVLIHAGPPAPPAN